MKLTNDRLKQLDNPTLTPEKRALLRCHIAAELIHTGQYETAREALGELWQGIGNRPDLKGLSILASAEVLLQCGVLSGWLGSTKQISDAQEKAKDLLTESLRKFHSQGQRVKVAEAKYELGRCYFRLGSYDEARLILNEAVDELDEKDAELKAKALIRRSLIEIWTGHYHSGLEILRKAEDFFEKCDDAIKGKWHSQIAIVLGKLANAERNTDYLDRAIIEYTAASFHYEQAKHERYRANNLNNLAMLLYEFNRYDEAHKYLDRAITALTRLNDEGLLAQVNETRARVLVAEGQYKEANQVISGVIQTFEKGGEPALLADALAIQGVIWARLGVYEGSINIIRRAMNGAYDSGASFNAGQAALTLIEEHGATRLPESELYETYNRADNMLKSTQDAKDIERLSACARIAVKRLFGTKISDKNFSLPDAILAYEARFIEQALELEQGSVTRAAKRLGIKHQTLSHILKARQRHLLHMRTPAASRKRSIIRKVSSRTQRVIDKQISSITILHVEDNKTIADTVKDILETEGWSVDSYSGVAAMKKIINDMPYDLLLLDNELHGLRGTELIQLSRKLLHRRRTPIIMLSASNCEAEAWRAGVDAFLRKPEDIPKIAKTIKRLLINTRPPNR
jgi:CheY-like chemotaxis protein/tetratricopeptide (TPR) repeat protein